jgi:hypothetical protein
MLSDLVIYDKHLTDDEVKEISDLLVVNVPRTTRCCWDGHTAVVMG